MKSFAALLRSFLLLSMLGVAAYGQNAGTGAIAGVVTDPTGAVIEGVVIKVTNNLTGEKRTAVSAGRGNYTVPLLPPGAYTVEASKAGFKNTSYRAITVSVTPCRAKMPCSFSSARSTRMRAAFSLAPHRAPISA